MRITIIICFLYFFSFTTTAFAQTTQPILLDKIVAKVGKHIILKSRIDAETQAALAQGIKEPELECAVLEQALLEKIFVTQAEIDSVEVGEAEVEHELDQRMNYFISAFNNDITQLEAYYGKSIAEIKNDLREKTRDLLAAQRMQGQVTGNTAITPSEVRDFYNALPPDSIPYINSEVEVGQLVITPKPTRAQKEVVINKLLDLRQQVLSGKKSFEDLAKGYSEDPGSAPHGGNLGWMQRGSLVPEYEGAAYLLKPNEISDVIESSYGLHIIQLIERRGEKINTRHILIRPVPDWAQNQATQKTLDSIRNLIVADSLNFKLAVEKYSDDENSKRFGGMVQDAQTGSSRIEMNRLDPTVFFGIDGLKQGEVSKPQEFKKPDGTTAYRILYLYERTQPHRANLKQDYARFQSYVENIKRQEALLKWLDRRIPETYVWLAPEFQNCTMSQRWAKAAQGGE
ncbi:MAG: peptidylprolyl isomerase [Sphingobacteriales bacterium]|nr:peptidylprolyl isomerase [Sphingobacteriales bacterium]MBP9141861.1 peptidylprolyl isomerase [Chitinophagales bacterium]MDA0199855.1 peptidylprolyl isomerase [Bacteroidota bacterium]MBK7528019.1 peptidylprolyl isomerase [Sphingobacteriales bacterium]MBK8679644.1 peptidylprolyl isomerase [Sphingobacteriales bacterium]